VLAEVIEHRPHEAVTTESKSTTSTDDDEPSSNRKKKKASEPKPTTTSADEPANRTETTTAKRTVSVTTASATTSTPAPEPVAPAETLAMVSTLGTASRELAQASVSGSTDTTTRGVTAQTVAVNPLGTPEQLAAEQRAAETVNTLPVQLMKHVLQFGWRATAQQQFNLVGGPDEENLDALNEAVNGYAMGPHSSSSCSIP
jgi:hypothetical protein